MAGCIKVGRTGRAPCNRCAVRGCARIDRSTDRRIDGPACPRAGLPAPSGSGTRGLSRTCESGRIVYMQRRLRFVAGLVTTVAMVISLAETIWAATCLPMNGPANAVVAAENGMAACDGCRPAPHDQPGDDERPCPFGPVAPSQNCVTTAVLPARATVDLGVATEADAVVLAFELEPELLLAGPLSRPPKP